MLDVGAGTGVITQELAKMSKKVIAIEIDRNLINQIEKNINIEIVSKDFLKYELPKFAYKVFANIPFSVTNEIIRKLVGDKNSPIDCYLMVQKEAAEKFCIKNLVNNMTAILYFPWWDIKVIHTFKRDDFYPLPKVDCVLLNIKKRTNPIINTDDKARYFDFVAHEFKYKRKAKYIKINDWLNNFKNLQADSIKGSYSKLSKEQKQLKKIHRTRLDKGWRRF